MNYSQYYLIPAEEIDKIEKIDEYSDKILPGNERWEIVVADTADSKLEQYVDMAIGFNNYEWDAWGFDFYWKGKAVVQLLFGENAEAGIDAEENYKKGSIQEMADLLKISSQKIEDILATEDVPDVEKFAELLDFPIMPVTAYDFE